MITTSNIPSHQFSVWLVQAIRKMLAPLDLTYSLVVEEVVYVVVVVCFALFFSWVLRRLLFWGAERLKFGRQKGKTAILHYRHLLRSCSHVVSPIVILVMLPFAFNGETALYRLIHTAVVIYMVIVIAVALSAVVNFGWERYNSRENTKNLPLAGIRNLSVGLVWIIALIIIGSAILGKSPAALLTGLGAFATVLMLIFKDSILGFVAGMQLSQNDMVRLGDWIVVPSTIANGIVVDMSLSTVKVRNWDNTIVMLPPYSLVSTSFQNWRGMSNSGSRLISQSVIFTADSVVEASPELLQSIEHIQGMENFISKVRGSGQFYDNGIASVNGTIQSNLGLYRAYMCHYLLSHQLVDKSQQILVRIMPIDGNGVPLQIYCYTATDWTVYEAVQSEIIEHTLSVAPKFELHLYSAPSNEVVEKIIAAR